MKRTEPEKVSRLLKGLIKDNDLLKLAEAHEELGRLWETIPDTTFANLSLELKLSTDGVLEILCPSSVALNYVRLRRPLLERHLSGFMQKHGISRLVFSLKN